METPRPHWEICYSPWSCSQQKCFSDVQMEPSVFYFFPVVYWPVIGHHWEEPGFVLPALSASPFIRGAPCSPLDTFWCFVGLFQVCPCFSCTGKPRNRLGISSVASIELNGGKGSPYSTCWQCSSSCSSVCYCLPLLQAGINDTFNLTTRTPIPSLESCFQACCSPSYTGAWVYSSRIWHFPLLNSYESYSCLPISPA